MDKMRILVMFASEYSLKGDDGRDVSGCTLNYYFWGQDGDLLNAVHAYEGSVGFQRAKCSIPFELRGQVCAAPAVYDATFAMKVGSDGKPVMTVTDLTYVGDVKFSLAK